MIKVKTVNGQVTINPTAIETIEPRSYTETKITMISGRVLVVRHTEAALLETITKWFAGGSAVLSGIEVPEAFE